jgi:hypothetical protein
MMWLILIGGIPLQRAAWANRRTTLAHALAWAAAAWLAWVASAAVDSALARYLALSLTGCAGVAVLGARRPGVLAWNAVVLSLAAVVLVPLAPFVLSTLPVTLDPIRLGFLAVAIAVGLLNYLPTRGGLGALAMLGACLIGLRRIDEPLQEWERIASQALVAAAPWLAWMPFMWRRHGGSECDRLWSSFRDRFGAIWAIRLRDQFARAAENAGLRVELRWRGLRKQDGTSVSEPEHAASLELLRALMQRFA